MNNFFVSVLIVVVLVIDFVVGVPATLCLRRSCDSDWTSCSESAWLQIRNGYFGEVHSVPSKGFTSETCSRDGVFCVQSLSLSRWDLYVTYGNTRRYLPGNFRRAVAGWCAEKVGFEYWFDT